MPKHACKHPPPTSHTAWSPEGWPRWTSILLSSQRRGEAGRIKSILILSYISQSHCSLLFSFSPANNPQSIGLYAACQLHSSALLKASSQSALSSWKCGVCVSTKEDLQLHLVQPDSFLNEEPGTQRGEMIYPTHSELALEPRLLIPCSSSSLLHCNSPACSSHLLNITNNLKAQQ